MITGNYTTDSIERVAKATDPAKLVREKLSPTYTSCEQKVYKPVLGHRRANWTDQVQHGVKDIQVNLIMI